MTAKPKFRAESWAEVFDIGPDNRIHGLRLTVLEPARAGVNSKPDGAAVPWQEYIAVDGAGTIARFRWFDPTRQLESGESVTVNESAWRPGQRLLAVAEGESIAGKPGGLILHGVSTLPAPTPDDPPAPDVPPYDPPAPSPSPDALLEDVDGLRKALEAGDTFAAFGRSASISKKLLDRVVAAKR